MLSAMANFHHLKSIKDKKVMPKITKENGCQSRKLVSKHKED